MKIPKKPKPLMSQSAYVKKSGCFCPMCGSSDLACSRMEADNKHAWQDVYCSNCNASWQDVYKLTGYRDLGCEVAVKPMEPFSLGEKN